VNPFCGLDTVEPFVQTAAAEKKGLFVLVRTSNPGSAALQDAVLADGRTYSQNLAGLLAPVAEKYVGESGWSSIGAVVGATQPQTMADMRKRLPRSIFLLPGYGVQGATAEMTREAFTPGGQGALVSASRSVLYAYKDAAYAHISDWKVATDQAVKTMIDEIGRVLK
jgi:orotidine-5'-phosphate decarboxylase